MDQKHDMISDIFEIFFRKHDAVFLLMDGETGQLIDANDAALSFYGYSMKQIKSMKIGDINKLPPEELDAERQKAVREKRKYFIVPHLLANGEIRIVEVHTTPIVLKNRKYLFSVIHDITEQKNAEKALSKSEDCLNDAQQLANIGSWEWDIEQKLLTWSDEVYRIFGVLPGAFKPSVKTFEATIHPEDLSGFLEEREKMLKEKQTCCIEHRIILPNGNVRFVQERTRLIIDAEGKVTRVIGTVQDITEKKLVEKDLRQTEIKLLAVLESTADGILAVDNKGKVINANQRFIDLWRIPRPVMNTGDDNVLLNFVLKQLIDPDAFLKKVKLLYGTDREDMETLYFKDGRIFERFSSPLIMDKDILGRVFSFRDVTERKKTEESLQTQSQILENLTEGVTLSDEKGNICFTNDKYDEMFGYKKGELIGKNVSALNAYSEKENIKFMKNVFTNLKAKGKWYGEILNRKKDGSVFYTRANISLAKLGNRSGFITVQGDITERKKNEEKLKASEEKYSTLVEKGNDGIIILQDNVLKYLNSIICEMTGFTRKELIGKPFLNYVSPEYRKIVIERYEKRLKGYDIPNRYEIEILAKDGRKTQIEINASQIEFEGKPASMAIIRDITERKKMERTLIESEERYRTLIENIDLGITLIDKNYKIVMANSEFCRRTGVSKEKVEGMSCYKLCAKRDSVCPDCSGTKAMALKKVVKVESGCLSYDGSRLPVIIHSFPVLDQNNEAKAFIEISEDISEYKKVEKAKNNLIRDLSHGLKTPVSMIEMSLGIIKNSMESGDKESLMKAKRIAEENIKKVRKDLNGILYEFSIDVRKEALSKSKKELKKASLKTIMKGAAENIRSSLESKNLKLVINIKPGADKIKINKNDLRTLLNNLLDNAIKFTEKGGISVTSRSKGEMIELEVKDTGCGISGKDINRVFDKFYKRHASIDGTGLGLSICKELAEMYGGKINIYSEGFGKGTMVIVSLPKA